MSDKRISDRSSLANEKCDVCQVGAPCLTEKELESLAEELPEWSIVSVDGVNQLRRTYSFSTYTDGLAFVNVISGLSEKYNHHPSILLEWGQVTLTWWTHKINGLHRTDSIMAAKSDVAYSL